MQTIDVEMRENPDDALKMFMKDMLKLMKPG
jgi:hypothetical protein